MQLTNIARDVGEDARAGRLYLPTDWLAEAGLDPETFLRDPLPAAPVRRMVARLLAEADRLYLRSEAGIAALPRDARMGIWAARLIYCGIGTALRRAGCDSISRRARTTRAQKLGWMLEAMLRAVAGAAMPRSAVLFAPPLPEAAWLVDAAARRTTDPGRTLALLDLLADLRARQAGVGPRAQRA
jgi:phytoene synthase